MVRNSAEESEVDYLKAKLVKAEATLASVRKAIEALPCEPQHEAAVQAVLELFDDEQAKSPIRSKP